MKKQWTNTKNNKNQFECQCVRGKLLAVINEKGINYQMLPILKLTNYLINLLTNFCYSYQQLALNLTGMINILQQRCMRKTRRLQLRAK